MPAITPIAGNFAGLSTTTAGVYMDVLNAPITPATSGADTKSNLDPVAFMNSLDPTAPISDTVKKLLTYQKQFEADKKNKASGDGTGDSGTSQLGDIYKSVKDFEDTSTSDLTDMASSVINTVIAAVL